MTNRGYGIVPALPTADTPYLTEEGYLHHLWRVYHEDVTDQLVFNGKDTIYENVLRLENVDGEGTNLEAFVTSVSEIVFDDGNGSISVVASRVDAVETRLDDFRGTGATIEAEVQRVDTATVNAQSTADGAQTTANSAATSANTTAARLNNFGGSGSDVEAEVSRVDSAASTAQSTADGAVTTANSASTSASNTAARLNNFNGTGLDVETEVGRVDTATSTAQTTADGAQTTADAAAGSANTTAARLNNFNGSGTNVEASVSTVSTAAATAQTTADGVQTQLNAAYTLEVTAGNVITGFRFENDGSRSDAVFEADNFLFKGSTTDVQFVSMSGNKVRFGTDVEIDGNLTIDGSIRSQALENGAVAFIEEQEIDNAGTLASGTGESSLSTFLASPLSYTPAITLTLPSIKVGAIQWTYRINTDTDGNISSGITNGWFSVILERPDGSTEEVRTAPGPATAVAQTDIASFFVQNATSGTFKLHLFIEEDWDIAQMAAFVTKAQA